MSKHWTDNELIIIKDNYSKCDNNNILKLLDRTLISIKIKAQQLGLLKNKNVKMNRRNGLNKLVTDNNLQKFYWIGFLLADGNVNENGRISLEIANKDKFHLEEYKNYFNIDNKIYLRKNRNTSSVVVNDIHCTEYLKEKFNFIHNKTYKPPNCNFLLHLSPEEKLSLFIGFLDGDGNIRVTNKGCITITLENHKSWLEFYQYFKEFISNYFNIFIKSKIRVNNRGYIVMTFSKREIFIKFIEFIRKNNLYVLKRKWNSEFIEISINFWKPHYRISSYNN